MSWALHRRAQRLIALCVFAVGVAQLSGSPSIADEAAVGPDDRATIQSVISDQLAAFRRDDGAAAFSHASPAIQDMFGTPGRFMEMVRRDYVAVYRPQQVTFMELAMIDGAMVQKHRLVGPDGVPVTAAYKMERQPSGHWTIGGVVLFRIDNEAI